MDQILYSIGLLFDSNSVEPIKRRSIYNPYFILMFLVSFSITRLLSLSTNDSRTLLMYGDVAYIVNLKTVNCVIVNLCSSMCILFQLIYYYNHKKGIKPTFIVVMQAICGSIPVDIIGVESEAKFRKLQRFSHRIFRLMKIQNNYIVPFTSGCCVLFLYGIETNISVITTFGFFHSLYWSFYMHIFINIVTYQILYVFILCIYFKLKVKSLNQTIINLKNSFHSSTRIQNIVTKFGLCVSGNHSLSYSFGEEVCPESCPAIANSRQMSRAELVLSSRFIGELAVGAVALIAI